ncbi:hypothetical protein EVAR_80272_1 [Eumeta japonica]|uniref:Uncharacterized protein n=1 Tax=Eumeta variegata TaxID=151549 RepID=A0A4C1UB54_EUMVA|nr:hypothetical protein EVAR_80272_1 [Eumeta japonica]
MQSACGRVSPCCRQQKAARPAVHEPLKVVHSDCSPLSLSGTRSARRHSRPAYFVIRDHSSIVLPCHRACSKMESLANDKADTANNLEEQIESEDALIAEKSTFQRGWKRGSVAKEDELITALTDNINKKYKENKSNNEPDDDKLFLLALHGILREFLTIID